MAAAPDDSPAPNSVAKTAAKVPLPSADDAGGAKLSGRVTYRGTPPARRVINMTKDAKCIELHGDKPVLDEDLIVSKSGGLSNVFVRVQRGAPKKDYPLPEEPAVLNQKDCMFHPRVQGVRVGQRLLVGNGDPVTHNVRSFPVLNPAFNFGQPPDTDPRERVFEKAEREIEIQCDFHLWMHAYVFVMEHPFFSVTDDDGTFAIEGLPPGKYTLEAWHEKLGRQRQTVTVGDDDLVDVNFTYPR
jgi:Carboxypeptidase regulatory-like domain